MRIPVPASRISVLAARQGELDARRVAAVAVHLRPGRRDRAARAPDLDPHHRRPRSPRAARTGSSPRTIPCSEATIGKALASISMLARRSAVRIVNAAVRRAAVADRLGRRRARRLDRGSPSLSNGPKAARPLLGAHPPGVLERAPEQRRGGLVVEDQRRVAGRAGRRAWRCSSAGCGPGSARAASAGDGLDPCAWAPFFHRLSLIATQALALACEATRKRATPIRGRVFSFAQPRRTRRGARGCARADRRARDRARAGLASAIRSPASLLTLRAFRTQLELDMPARPALRASARRRADRHRPLPLPQPQARIRRRRPGPRRASAPRSPPRRAPTTSPAGSAATSSRSCSPRPRPRARSRRWSGSSSTLEEPRGGRCARALRLGRHRDARAIAESGVAARRRRLGARAGSRRGGRAGGGLRRQRGSEAATPQLTGGPAT